MSPKTVFITQESPANALALNKDYSQVVIAGRNVFKVFSLGDNGFDEVCNLRVGKNLNLNFSCNDVAWNLIDDHILATAATNGAVVLWNLNRPSRSKQEHVFIDHKRTVNKVSFHMTEPHLLISGSQDGTMKCFDLRTREVVKTFYSNTESVRDVQFSPHQVNTFCAVSENGHVQLWDLRRSDRHFQHFTAHSGPIFSCDWHPDSTWLATASRDKTIKVWDLSVKPTCEYTINTIASVGRIKWRPQHKYHIASSSLVLDFSINVWDLRRPYIPLASFNEHKDVPTGLAWLNDPEAFLSISRDCTLYQHDFKDATHPARRANPAALAINLRGDIFFACDVNIAARPSLRNTGNVPKKTAATESSCSASSVFWQFRNPHREPSSFQYFAENYKFIGELSDICDHNAKVATDFGYEHLTRVWMILKTIYVPPTGDQILKTATKDETLNLGQLNLNTSTEQRTTDPNNDTRSLPGDGPSAVSGGDDETETDDTPETHNILPHIPSGSRIPSHGYKRPPLGDFIFGDEDEDPIPVDPHRNYFLMDHEEDWVLEQEAFPLRHEIQDRSPPPEQFPNTSPEINNASGSAPTEEPPQLVVNSILKPTAWDPSPIVKQVLEYHVEMGDLQTSVMILYALGDKRKTLDIDIGIQEHWVLEYIELLSMHKLYTVMAAIIKFSWIPYISQMNQQSTTYRVCCSTCKKPLHRAAWRCDTCKSSEHALCSICHQVVRGMYVWCRGCAHGGHVKHIQDWFRSNRACPTGCGHLCEYSN